MAATTVKDDTFLLSKLPSTLSSLTLEFLDLHSIYSILWKVSTRYRVLCEYILIHIPIVSIFISRYRKDMSISTYLNQLRSLMHFPRHIQSLNISMGGRSRWYTHQHLTVELVKLIEANCNTLSEVTYKGAFTPSEILVATSKCTQLTLWKFDDPVMKYEILQNLVTHTRKMKSISILLLSNPKSTEGEPARISEHKFIELLSRSEWCLENLALTYVFESMTEQFYRLECMTSLTSLHITLEYSTSTITEINTRTWTHLLSMMCSLRSLKIIVDGDSKLQHMIPHLRLPSTCVHVEIQGLCDLIIHKDCTNQLQSLKLISGSNITPNLLFLMRQYPNLAELTHQNYFIHECVLPFENSGKRLSLPLLRSLDAMNNSSPSISNIIHWKTLNIKIHSYYLALLSRRLLPNLSKLSLNVDLPEEYAPLVIGNLLLQLSSTVEELCITTEKSAHDRNKNKKEQNKQLTNQSEPFTIQGIGSYMIRDLSDHIPLPHLQMLTLYYCATTGLLNRLYVPQLTYLQLSTVRGDNNIHLDLTHILSQCSLRLQHLQCYYQFQLQELKSLPTLPNLTKLHIITDMNLSTSQSFVRLLILTPSLVHLRVQHVKSNDVMNHLVASFYNEGHCNILPRTLQSLRLNAHVTSINSFISCIHPLRDLNRLVVNWNDVSRNTPEWSWDEHDVDPELVEKDHEGNDDELQARASYIFHYLSLRLSNTIDISSHLM